MPSNREQILKQFETERGARAVQAKCLAAQASSKAGSPAATLATRQTVVAKAIVRRREVETMLEEKKTLRREAREKERSELEQCRKRTRGADEALQPLRTELAKLSARLAASKGDADRKRAELERAKADRIAAARDELDRAVREGDEPAELLAAERLQVAQAEAVADLDLGTLGLRVDSLGRQVARLQEQVGQLEEERKQLEAAAQLHEVRLAEIEHDDLVAALLVASAKAMAEHAKLNRLKGSGGAGPRALPLKFFNADHVPYASRAVYPGDLPESVAEQLRVELFAELDMSAFDADPKDLEGFGQVQPLAA